MALTTCGAPLRRVSNSTAGIADHFSQLDRDVRTTGTCNQKRHNARCPTLSRESNESSCFTPQIEDLPRG